MYIYNLTLTIENDIHDKWLKWMKTVYIPAMLATDKFTEAALHRVLTRQKDGTTYAAQFQSPDKATFKQYYVEHHAAMAKKLKQFGENLVFFGTEMKVIDQQP